MAFLLFACGRNFSQALSWSLAQRYFTLTLTEDAAIAVSVGNITKFLNVGVFDPEIFAIPTNGRNNGENPGPNGQTCPFVVCLVLDCQCSKAGIAVLPYFLNLRSKNRT